MSALQSSNDAYDYIAAITHPRDTAFRNNPVRRRAAITGLSIGNFFTIDRIFLWSLSDEQKATWTRCGSDGIEHIGWTCLGGNIFTNGLTPDFCYGNYFSP
jgi:hypothetical protein